jgi:hypothetical protein
MGDVFWSSLADPKNILKEEDRSLLKEIFKPTLTDRQAEGDLFVPPDTGFSYVQKMRELVKEEEVVQQQRKEAFFCKTFSKGSPGLLFPHTWTPSFEIARGLVSVPEPEDQSENVRYPRPELLQEAGNLLNHVLKTSSPVFDKSTEEGLRFRIYTIGTLEVPLFSTQVKRR